MQDIILEYSTLSAFNNLPFKKMPCFLREVSIAIYKFLTLIVGVIRAYLVIIHICIIDTFKLIC